MCELFNNKHAVTTCLLLLNLVKHVIKLFREATDDLVSTVLVNWFKQDISDICKTTYICALSSSLSESSGKRHKKTMHFCLFWIYIFFKIANNLLPLQVSSGHQG